MNEKHTTTNIETLSDDDDDDDDAHAMFENRATEPKTPSTLSQTVVVGSFE